MLTATPPLRRRTLRWAIAGKPASSQPSVQAKAVMERENLSGFIQAKAPVTRRWSKSSSASASPVRPAFSHPVHHSAGLAWGSARRAERTGDAVSFVAAAARKEAEGNAIFMGPATERKKGD